MYARNIYEMNARNISRRHCIASTNRRESKKPQVDTRNMTTVIGQRPVCSIFLRVFGAILLCVLFSVACDGAFHQRAVAIASKRMSIARYNYVLTRGGSVEVESEDDEEVNVESDDEGSDEEDETMIEPASGLANTLLSVTKRTVFLLGKATIVTAKALTRAIVAGFSGEDVLADNDDEVEMSIMTKMIRTFRRMWTAAFSVSDTESEAQVVTSDKSSTGKSKNKSSKKSTSSVETTKDEPDVPTDFGSFLAKAYQVSSDRDKAVPILGGTIGDALRDARSKARLLVVFIPSARPGPSKKITADQVAIRSLLSEQVAHTANRRSRKNVDYGSFELWGARASSPEAITAIKRLKAKQPSKNEKRPYLLVAYPAQVIDSSGKPRLVPKLLAQHHCSPPPSPDSMAAWLNALRKRHAKQFASMQHELKELQLFKERTEGYKSSVESDIQRRETEKREELERIAREKAEKERLEAIERRREELRSLLPSEPGKDTEGVMTIALRFADGQSGTRRFLPDTPIQTMFNWVDAMYGIEREQVVLTTMNGRQTFEWNEDDEMTLGSSGLSRMTGLRVSERKVEDRAEETSTHPVKQ